MKFKVILFLLLTICISPRLKRSRTRGIKLLNPLYTGIQVSLSTDDDFNALNKKMAQIKGLKDNSTILKTLKEQTITVHSKKGVTVKEFKEITSFMILNENSWKIEFKGGEFLAINKSEYVIVRIAFVLLSLRCNIPWLTYSKAAAKQIIRPNFSGMLLSKQIELLKNKTFNNEQLKELKIVFKYLKTLGIQNLSCLSFFYSFDELYGPTINSIKKIVKCKETDFNIFLITMTCLQSFYKSLDFNPIARSALVKFVKHSTFNILIDMFMKSNSITDLMIIKYILDYEMKYSIDRKYFIQFLHKIQTVENLTVFAQIVNTAYSIETIYTILNNIEQLLYFENVDLGDLRSLIKHYDIFKKTMQENVDLFSFKETLNEKFSKVLGVYNGKAIDEFQIYVFLNTQGDGILKKLGNILDKIDMGILTIVLNSFKNSEVKDKDYLLKNLKADLMDVVEYYPFINRFKEDELQSILASWEKSIVLKSIPESTDSQDTFINFFITEMSGDFYKLFMSHFEVLVKSFEEIKSYFEDFFSKEYPVSLETIFKFDGKIINELTTKTYGDSLMRLEQEKLISFIKRINIKNADCLRHIPSMKKIKSKEAESVLLAIEELNLIDLAIDDVEMLYYQNKIGKKNPEIFSLINKIDTDNIRKLEYVEKNLRKSVEGDGAYRQFNDLYEIVTEIFDGFVNAFTDEKNIKII
jgi:hypothetical protein